MAPVATTSYENPKRVETVDGSADPVREGEFIGRFHIRKNLYTGQFDVTATRKSINTDKRVYVIEAVVCRHINVQTAMLCAQGIDCKWGIPVGRLT